MSSQADVHSIDALKEFRTVLALYSEEALGALGSVKMEARRTLQWVQHDRKTYWQTQIKRRREQVSSARAEVARRKLAKTPEHTPAFSEQKELLRLAEASLREAEAKVILVKKWEPAIQLAVLELHASIRRISDLAGTDTARASLLLGRLVDALEAYVREASPSGVGIVAGSALDAIAGAVLAAADTETETETDTQGKIGEPAPDEAALDDPEFDDPPV